MQLFRPFKTRFPYGFVSIDLTSRHRTTRHIIMQKARRRPERIIGLRLLVDTRFQVLFHSPNRGAFHLSLTVLVHYRSLERI